MKKITIISFFLFLLTYFSCSPDKIEGRFELTDKMLTEGKSYYETPVLPLPKYLILNDDKSFSSSLPMHGTYKIEGNSFVLTVPNESAQMELNIRKNLFGKVYLTFGDIRYSKSNL